MTDYSLDNYKLSTSEFVQSFFLSEYALRHFSEVKKSNTWNGRIVHAIIGAALSIPILGGIGSILERNIVDYSRKSETKLSEKNVKQLELSEKNVKQLEPFRSKIFHHHRAINELNTPEFKEYAQGLIEINVEQLIPKDLKDKIESVEVSFSYEGKIFYTQCETHEHFEVFLQNMPFNEEITININVVNKDKKELALDPTTFKTDKKNGVYQIANGKMIESSPLVQPTTIAENSNPGMYPMGSMFLDQSLKIIMNANGGLSFAKGGAEDREFFLFDNQSPYANVLYLELDGSSTEDKIDFSKGVISLPIVVLSNEKKGISKEYLITNWKEAYEKATEITAPENPVIRLLYIQQDSYGNPFLKTGLEEIDQMTPQD